MNEMEGTNQPAPKKKRRWLKWLVIAVIVLIVLNILGGRRELSVSEADLNAKLAESLHQPVDNPLTAADLDLQTNRGLLSLTWSKGQTMQAEIVVSPDGRRLVARNTDVSGAGAFNQVFEGVAQLVLNNTLTTISLSQRNLQQIEIREDVLVGFYGLR